MESEHTTPQRVAYEHRKVSLGKNPDGSHLTLSLVSWEPKRGNIFTREGIYDAHVFFHKPGNSEEITGKIDLFVGQRFRGIRSATRAGKEQFKVMKMLEEPQQVI